jgi:VanZ family protein
MNAIYHVSLLLILSIWSFSRKRVSVIILVLLVPVLGEAAQLFIPGRTPDFIDVFHGYLGILIGYCLVKMWRELKPVVKNAKFNLIKTVIKRN